MEGRNSSGYLTEVNFLESSYSHIFPYSMFLNSSEILKVRHFGSIFIQIQVSHFRWTYPTYKVLSSSVNLVKRIRAIIRLPRSECNVIHFPIFERNHFHLYCLRRRVLPSIIYKIDSSQSNVYNIQTCQHLISACMCKLKKSSVGEVNENLF